MVPGFSTRGHASTSGTGTDVPSYRESLTLNRTQIKIYRRYGRWYYTLRDDQFERFADLGIDDDAGEEAALEAARDRFSHLGDLRITRARDLP
jgi:hypothetical protein